MCLMTEYTNKLDLFTGFQMNEWVNDCADEICHNFKQSIMKISIMK